MHRIHVFATWRVKEGQIETVLALAAEAARESAKEPGNLFYTVHQSNTDLRTLVLFEGYADEAALAAHRETPHFREIVLGKIVPLLEHREVILAAPLVADPRLLR